MGTKIYFKPISYPYLPCLVTLIAFLFCFILDRISLCSPVWSSAHNPLASVSQALGLYSILPCQAMLSSSIAIKKERTILGIGDGA